MKHKTGFEIFTTISMSATMSLAIVVLSWFILAILQDVFTGRTELNEISVFMVIQLAAAGLVTLIVGLFVSIPAAFAYYYILQRRIAQKKFKKREWVFDGAVVGIIYAAVQSYFIDYDLEDSLGLIVALSTAGALAGYFTWKSLGPFEGNLDLPADTFEVKDL
jgi:uncharacterized membrane protein